MLKRYLQVAVLAIVAVGVAGCGTEPRRAPSLVATTVPAGPAKKGFLESAGDTTWNVVTAPARLISGTGTKKAPPSEPETYEPAEVVIMPRSGIAAEQPASRPATTQGH
jgi:hypothetical protein